MKTFCFLLSLKEYVYVLRSALSTGGVELRHSTRNVSGMRMWNLKWKVWNGNVVMETECLEVRRFSATCRIQREAKKIYSSLKKWDFLNEYHKMFSIYLLHVETHNSRKIRLKVLINDYPRNVCIFHSYYFMYYLYI